MKIVYTDAAKEELAKFRDAAQSHLEDVIAEKKFVYGDDTLEITASDIKQASSIFRAPPLQRMFGRYVTPRIMAVAGPTYFVLGVLLIAGALLYPTIKALLATNGVYMPILIVGGVFAFIGLGMMLASRNLRALRVRANTFEAGVTTLEMIGHSDADSPKRHPRKIQFDDRG
jgi:hypothetical protein